MCWEWLRIRRGSIVLMILTTALYLHQQSRHATSLADVLMMQEQQDKYGNRILLATRETFLYKDDLRPFKSQHQRNVYHKTLSVDKQALHNSHKKDLALEQANGTIHDLKKKKIEQKHIRAKEKHSKPIENKSLPQEHARKLNNKNSLLLRGNASQEVVDYFSEAMTVVFRVLNNTYYYYAEVVLTNSGATTLPQVHWQLYLYHLATVTLESSNASLLLTHIGKSFLYKLEPKNNFPAIPPGGNFTFVLFSHHLMVSRSNIMPNWYVTSPSSDVKPKVLQSTKGNFMERLTSPVQWRRGISDTRNPFSPRERYDKNYIKDSGRTSHSILPTPLFMNITETGRCDIDATWVVTSSEELQAEAAFISSILGIKVIKTSRTTKYIRLHLADVVPRMNLASDDSYRLQVKPDSHTIHITGPTPRGIFYGIQTLLALLHQAGTGSTLSEVTILDAPRFEQRGFMLDVARNFFGYKTIMKLIELMSMLKLNKLHLHLTDSEGWRLEIPGLEELTKVGSRRGHDLQQMHYLMSDLGSGPLPNGLGCGHYTTKQYRNILKHGKKFHVDIIPEIDLPGHSQAAILAMRSRYFKYQQKGNITEARKYILIEENELLAKELFGKREVNPCLESTYVFTEHVIKELVKMHQDIKILKALHLGGDEVKYEGVMTSPACQALGVNGTHINVKRYYIKRIIQIAQKFHINLHLWGDLIYMHNTPLHSSIFHRKLKSKVVVNAWRMRWTTSESNRAYQLANYNYQVVMSSSSHLYWDHPQEPDPNEAGLTWATDYTDLYKVFVFMPFNIYANIHYDHNGLLEGDMTREVLCASRMDCIPLKAKKNIAGIEGHLWTELVQNEGQMWEMVLPRLLGLAERAWHEARWEAEKDTNTRGQMIQQDWSRFSHMLGKHTLPRLEKLGYRYYLPAPGIKVSNDKIKLNTQIPGVIIQVSTDGGRSWKDCHDELQSTAIELGSLFASRSFNGKWRSKPVKYTF